ncbi:MAG: hypothetical protein U9P14_06995 [Gemmatimonadota bacterium]|nr:hypothetical protein [Gemmatimonadota bacterium]
MAVTEIPQSGVAYRVQQVDKDPASQQDNQNRKEKKKLKKAKSKDDLADSNGNPHRINLLV